LSCVMQRYYSGMECITIPFGVKDRAKITNWKNIRTTSDINELDDMPKRPYRERR